MTYADEVLADSPVAYWRFEETSGTTVADETGNGHDGTTSGGVSLDTSGQVGSAGGFDGSDDYLDVGTLGSFAQEVNQSWECWIRTTTSDRCALLGTANDGSTMNHQLQLNTDIDNNLSTGSLRLFWRFDDGGPVDGEVGAPTIDWRDGSWHHLVWRLEGGSPAIRVWIDGNEQSFTYDDGIAPADAFADFQYPLVWGARNDRSTITQHADVDLDEAAIYNTLLSPTRVQAHYDAAQPSTEEVVLEAHTVLLKHVSLFGGRFVPHVVQLRHLKAVPLQYHVVNLAHLASTFRGDNSEGGQAQALKKVLGHGWGIPNPAGSANEKIETPRETWPIDRFHEAERLMRQEGVDEETVRGVGEAMRRLGEDIQLDVRQNLQKAQWHANVHTHSGSKLFKEPVATVDVYDLVKLPNGNFWTTVGNSGDKVREFDSDWNLTGKEFRNPAAGSLGRSRGITFDGRYLWLSGDDSDLFYQVDHLNGGEVVSEIAIDNTDLGSIALVGLAFDGIDIWVVETNSFIIWQFDVDGTEKQELVFSDVYSIHGLAYWNGHIYFTDTISSQVVKMSPNGDLVDFYDVSDVTAFPSGIWISDTGKALISEDDVGVWEFDLPG